MSEQSKSNVQALGAGLMGFAAVMVIGGGALLVHRSQQAKAGAPPAAAAAPIDLGSSMPSPSMAPTAHKERRAESPAPLIGETEEAQAPAPEEASAPRAAAAAAAASAAPSRAAGARLEVTRHLDAEGGSTTAVATVNDSLSPEKAPSAPEKTAARRKAAPVPDATGGAIASVHYGATSRSELMGRAAGPVYNVKGGGRTASAPTGKMADDVTIKIAELRRQLDSAHLPAEDRDKLQRELDAVTKGLAAPAAAQ